MPDITIDWKRVLVLPKWAVVPGALLIIGSILLHPNSCVTGADLISKFLTPDNQKTAADVSIGLGSLVLLLAKSILHEEIQHNVST